MKNFVIRLMSDGTPCPYGLNELELEMAIKSNEFLMTNEQAIQITSQMQEAWIQFSERRAN